MARSKYPELTVEKILDAAQKLFLEKGYEQTTIQDSVDELGGLTKGAIYHHFKAKEEIMNALGTKIFLSNNPFNTVRSRKDLNGLQKIQQAMLLNQLDGNKAELTKQIVPMLKNPRILAGMIEANKDLLSPILLEFIEEGKKDGSITTQFSKELSEIIPLLEVWLMPSIFPANEEEQRRKFIFMKEFCDHMGLPIFDEQITKMVNDVFSERE